MDEVPLDHGHPSLPITHHLARSVQPTCHPAKQYKEQTVCALGIISIRTRIHMGRRPLGGRSKRLARLFCRPHRSTQLDFCI